MSNEKYQDAKKKINKLVCASKVSKVSFGALLLCSMLASSPSQAIGRLEAGVDQIEKGLDDLGRNISRLPNRLERIADDLERNIDHLPNRIERGLDDLERRFNRLSNRVERALNNFIDRVQGAVESLIDRLGRCF